MLSQKADLAQKIASPLRKNRPKIAGPLKENRGNFRIFSGFFFEGFLPNFRVFLTFLGVLEGPGAILGHFGPFWKLYFVYYVFDFSPANFWRTFGF